MCFTIVVFSQESLHMPRVGWGNQKVQFEDVDNTMSKKGQKENQWSTKSYIDKKNIGQHEPHLKKEVESCAP